MTKKLTLSMKEDAIERAKALAAEQGTSVSAMFTDWVYKEPLRKRRRKIRPGRLALQASGMLRLPADKKAEEEFGPLTRKALGIGQAPPDKDYKDLITEALLEKYGLDK